MRARPTKYLAAGALALSLGSFAIATPAEAQYRYHRGNVGGAIAAGVIGGLALGAIGGAIAAPRYGYGYSYAPAYGYGYAPAGYGYGYNSVYDYGSNPVYYSGFAGGPAYGYGYAPRRVVYGGYGYGRRAAYFSNGYGYGGCRVVSQRVRLDPYTVGIRRVRVCN